MCRFCSFINLHQGTKLCSCWGTRISTWVKFCLLMVLSPKEDKMEKLNFREFQLVCELQRLSDENNSYYDPENEILRILRPQDQRALEDQRDLLKQSTEYWCGYKHHTKKPTLLQAALDYVHGQFWGNVDWDDSEDVSFYKYRMSLVSEILMKYQDLFLGKRWLTKNWDGFAE